MRSCSFIYPYHSIVKCLLLLCFFFFFSALHFTPQGSILGNSLQELLCFVISVTGIFVFLSWLWFLAVMKGGYGAKGRGPKRV